MHVTRLLLASGHRKFMARTVLVKNNDIEPAYRLLDRYVQNKIFNWTYLITIHLF